MARNPWRAPARRPLRGAVAAALAPEAGYFVPGSMYWRVNREAVLMLAGPRALLLELAHPLVAAGVAQHSEFRRAPLRRLYQTIKVMSDVSFLPQAQARRAVQHMRRCHAPVQGVLREAVGPYLAGTPYRAGDLSLQLWVLATLVDSVVATHHLLIRPLTAAEKDEYYAGIQRLGQVLGLPAELMPPTYADFETYVDRMIHSDALTVGPQAREAAAAFFDPPIIGPAFWLASQIGIGLLPPRLRAEFGLEWTERDEQRLRTQARIVRRLRHALPNAMSANPQALLAEWRLRKTSEL
jgi:uncharacterized protein (DUF2236 family)